MRLSLVLAAAFFLAGCDKVTEDECRQALANIDRIYDREASPQEMESAVRQCRAFSTRDNVECWSAAKTPQDFVKCGGKDPAAAAAAPADASK